MKLDIKKLLVSILGVQLVGFVGAWVTMPAVRGWYQTLNQPAITPPDSVFAPVWTTLYLLMGLSVYMVWTSKTKKKAKQAGLELFGLQLVLNSAWSILFFAAGLLWIAYFEILALAYVLILTIKQFEQVSKPAAWMLYPYLAWVAFASFLNLGFAVLN